MNCPSCESEFIEMTDMNSEDQTTESTYVCKGCNTNFAVTVRIIAEKEYEIFKTLKISQDMGKGEIITHLGTKYTVEDLGDSVFIKQPARPETFCISFYSTSDDSEISQIRQIRDSDGKVRDEVLYP